MLALQVFQHYRRTWTAPGQVDEQKSHKKDQDLDLWWHLLRISPAMYLPLMIPRKRGCWQTKRWVQSKLILFLTCTIKNVLIIHCNSLFKFDSLFVRVVGASAYSSFDMVGLRQQFPGIIKKVSHFFTKLFPGNCSLMFMGQFTKVVLFPTNQSPNKHETVNDPLQVLGATGGQYSLHPTGWWTDYSRH